MSSSTFLVLMLVITGAAVVVLVIIGAPVVVLVVEGDSVVLHEDEGKSDDSVSRAAAACEGVTRAILASRPDHN
jgi:hypothetical protein